MWVIRDQVQTRSSARTSFEPLKEKKKADSKGTASLMAWHDIVPLGHNTSASGHAEGTAPDSDGLWEAAGLEGTGSSLGISSRGCEGYRNRKGKRKYRYRKGKRGFFLKKKVLFSRILWDCTGTGQRDATQTLCPNWSVLNAWMTFKYAYSPCLLLASSSSPNPQGSLLLIYLWFLDRHGLFWLREESYCDFPSFLAPPKIKQTGYFTALCLQSLCCLAKGAGPQRPVSLLHWALQFLEKTGKVWCVMTSSLLLNCSVQKFGSDLGAVWWRHTLGLYYP